MDMIKDSNCTTPRLLNKTHQHFSSHPLLL